MYGALTYVFSANYLFTNTYLCEKSEMFCRSTISDQKLVLEADQVFPMKWVCARVCFFWVRKLFTN